jgi:DNA-binding response OmpR family regulator
MEDQSRKKDVLFLDDEPQVAAALAFAIDGLEFDLRPVGAPAAFWSEFERRSPDLVLLDVKLTDSSGLTLLRELRRRVEATAIPVIVLSGLVDPRVRLSAVVAGADDYVCKPVDPDELVDRMRDQLTRKVAEE